MSIPAQFVPLPDDSINFNNKPVSTSSNHSVRNNFINQYYVKHVYSTLSTIPTNYLYWFSPSPLKTLTVTGESKAQVLKIFRSAVLQTKLELACITGVELHCSGYLQQVINILIEIIGSHVHIHNPNIGTRLLERYRKFKGQIELPSRNSGTTEFPENNDEHFFKRPEVLGYRSTLNCQPVRNFVVEIISIVTLSHQKELTLPKIDNKDVNHNYLYSAAKSLNIGGKNLMKVISKNELKVILDVVQKYLLHKNSKTEEAVYWILWLIKLEAKIKRKGEELPCQTMKIEGVPSKQTNHWVWYVWKSLFSRLSFCPTFKKKQIVDLYELFKIDFTKTIVNQRLPILFFAIRLLKYDNANNFPSILNNLHLHIQAYSNVNTLYRNLQIKLARKSWVKVVGDRKVQNKINQSKINKNNDEPEKPKRKSKGKLKEMEQQRSSQTLNKKTAYLDIIPTASNHF